MGLVLLVLLCRCFGLLFECRCRRLRILRQHRCLAERRSQRRVLDAELIDQGAALFPSPIGLVSRLQGCVEQLGSRLEELYMLVAAFAECPLRLSVLFCALAVAQLAPAIAAPGAVWAARRLGWLLRRRAWLGHAWRRHSSWSIVDGVAEAGGQLARHGMHEGVWRGKNVLHGLLGRRRRCWLLLLLVLLLLLRRGRLLLLLLLGGVVGGCLALLCGACGLGNGGGLISEAHGRLRLLQMNIIWVLRRILLLLEALPAVGLLKR